MVVVEAELGLGVVRVDVEVEALTLMAEEALGVEGPSSSSESSSQAISSSSLVVLVAPVCHRVLVMGQSKSYDNG